MKKRKYITEFSILYKNTRWCMLTANQLMSDLKLDKDTQDVANKSHIYIIASRPASYYKEGTLLHKDSMLSGEVGFRENGVEKTLPFSNLPFEFSNGATSVAIAPYPHRDILAYNEQGEEVYCLPSTTLVTCADAALGFDIFHNFEVLYVGQAFGDGSRSAQTRLQTHATLQKILAKTAHEYPDKEIVIFMLEFEFEQIISAMDGRAVGAIDTDENEDRLFKAIENPPTKKQKISLVEAGLIRYFQPHYNEIFKVKFPSTKLKTLQSCYELDISGLIVELNISDEFDLRLHSPTVKASWVHFARYDLVSPFNRASFFNISCAPNMPGIIEAVK